MRLVVLLAVLSTGIVYASDWHYAGSTRQGNVEALTFFDAESISHPSKDATRVWVKSIRARDLERYFKTHKKIVIEKSAERIAFGNAPVFLSLPAIKATYADKDALDSAVAELASDEMMANTPDIQPVSKFYFEIDCAGKRIKLVDGVLFNNDGSMSSKPGRISGNFGFIAPDSNGEWLSLLVCPTK